jgi:hypothetical protein
MFLLGFQSCERVHDRNGTYDTGCSILIRTPDLGTGVSKTNHIELVNTFIVSQYKEGCNLNMLAAELGGQKYTLWAQIINPVEAKPGMSPDCSRMRARQESKSLFMSESITEKLRSFECKCSSG